MKKILMTLCLSLGGLAAVKAQGAQEPPKFRFTEETYDFREIPEGPVAEHVFKFTNAGGQPLIIQSAAGSCECTVPEWPHKPILPGESSEITVKYKTDGHTGFFEKTVYIVSNASAPRKRYELHIKGSVTAKK